MVRARQPDDESDRRHAEDASGHHEGMGDRGVARPMARREHHHDEAAPQDPGGGGEQPAEHGQMTPKQRQQMLHDHHRRTLWVYWTLVLLGCWMLLSPLTFSYGSGIVQPAGGRELWLTDQARVIAMTWSDLVSGALLVIFGWRGLTPNRPVSLWACCFVGIWLSFAPVLFWAPTAAAYLNATVVGLWVMALAVLIPGMPNMTAFMKMGGAQPPGWSFNPSSWPQRSVLIALAFGGWATSRYLAAYQLGYIPHVWDPFFGDGSRRVLESAMSAQFPISDAAFGAFAYTFEFLMGFMGANARWRSMPWMVAFFGILVIPLGLVHLALVIAQPVMVGAWCSFCLLAAAFMLPMIPLTVAEVVAMGQHLRAAHREGEGFWKVFWKGGPPLGATPDERSPEMLDLPREPLRLARAAVWGMSMPWTLTCSAAAGLIVMVLPALLGVTPPLSFIFQVGGALVVVVAVIAMGEPLRLARYLNVLVGLTIVLGPWMLDGSLGVKLAAGAGGGLILALSLPRGVVRENYGSWDRWVR